MSLRFLSCAMSARCKHLSLVKFWLELLAAVCQNSRSEASRVNMHNTGWHLAPTFKRRVELFFPEPEEIRTAY